MDIHFFLGLFNHIPIELKLFLAICVIPILCLILDDLHYRGKSGLKRGK